MRNEKTPRGLLNEELAAVEWSERDTLAVLCAAEQGGRKSMKFTMKLALTMGIALAMMATTALAATLLFSPRYEALLIADQALLEKYGITEDMHPGLNHTISETGDKTIVTYDVLECRDMLENRFGTYTVTIVGGEAVASWSMDGLDTSGGLDAPAWGAEQLRMYVQEYAVVMSYLELNGMLVNAPKVTPNPADILAQHERDMAEILSMAKITLDDADRIGREAIVMRYGLTEGQAGLLVRYTDDDEYSFEDESSYEMAEGRPLVNLFFHLEQKSGYMGEDGYYMAGEWMEKDGIYVVTINLLDGAVEDICYDNGLMGNG